jgi:hypothetical protein
MYFTDKNIAYGKNKATKTFYVRFVMKLSICCENFSLEVIGGFFRKFTV